MDVDVTRKASTLVERVQSIRQRYLRSWRTVATSFLAFWVVFTAIQSNVSDAWFGWNILEPWTPADYPPLCSENTGQLLPWMAGEYAAFRQPDSTIRLLYLHPSKTVFAGLEASLKTASFLERPRYRALSYESGEMSRKRPISINGKRMDVGINLWNALYRIRDDERTVVLWVDAICIDQSNNEEKSVQVPLMSFIYSRALEVLVWLGEHTAPRWVETSTVSQWHRDWAISKASEDWAVTKYWLYLLAQEDYWHRCWTVQEITLASRVRVISGQASLPWADFVGLMRHYKARVPLDGKTIDDILRLEILRQAKYRNRDSYSLNRLLDQFHDCFASERLDKIYAFVGMASECINTCVPVNYTRSHLSVYQDLVLYWNARHLQTVDDSINMAWFAGMVRSILSRRSVLVPKVLTPPGISESANSMVYFLCGSDRAQYCKLIPTLTSLLAWADELKAVYHQIASFLTRSSSRQTNLWLSTEQESAKTWMPRSRAETENNKAIVSLRGLVAGNICLLGPQYREFIESPAAPRRWTSTLGHLWGLVCNETSMRSANTINERLTMLLGAGADYRISNFVSLDADAPYSFYSSRLFVAFGPERDVIMGLAPWNAMPGDLLIQYWNTDAVLVARKNNGQIDLIGRAGVVRNGEVGGWAVTKDKQLFESPASAIVDHTLGLSNLTRLTLDTVCWPGKSTAYFDDIVQLPNSIWTSHDFESAEISGFGSLNGYENDWDTGVRIPFLSHKSEDDLEKSCLETPCWMLSP